MDSREWQAAYAADPNTTFEALLAEHEKSQAKIGRFAQRIANNGAHANEILGRFAHRAAEAEAVVRLVAAYLDDGRVEEAKDIVQVALVNLDQGTV